MARILQLRLTIYRVAKFNAGSLEAARSRSNPTAIELAAGSEVRLYFFAFSILLAVNWPFTLSA